MRNNEGTFYDGDLTIGERKRRFIDEKIRTLPAGLGEAEIAKAVRVWLHEEGIIVEEYTEAIQHCLMTRFPAGIRARRALRNLEAQKRRMGFIGIDWPQLRESEQAAAAAKTTGTGNSKQKANK